MEVTVIVCSLLLSARNRKFPLNRVILLYAVIVYLQNKDTITEEQFARRMRIVNNLVRNSEDEVSDSSTRSGGNRMPVILQQVDDIIIHATMDASLVGLSSVQMKEEIEKLEWTERNSDRAEKLFALEDHYLLFGQIGMIGLEHVEFFEKFMKLFECDLDYVDSALMVTGNYIRCERNNWRYQLGTSNHAVQRAWQDLFHKSASSGYENTKSVLCQLLSELDCVTNEELIQIVNAYIEKCEKESVFDWKYYYVKYQVFRPGSYGKYYWKNFEEEPYVVRVMLTGKNLSENSYQPFLKAVDKDNHISKDDYGEYLIEADGKTYIGVEQSEYVVYSIEDDSEVKRIPIKQNDDKVDVEDRIKQLE